FAASVRGVPQTRASKESGASAAFETNLATSLVLPVKTTEGNACETNGAAVPPMIDPTDTVLVTGAAGFIGARVVRNLIERGFRRIRCFTRRSDKTMRNNVAGWRDAPGVEMIHGNLLSPEDCRRAAANVALIYHLAA